MYSMNPEAEEYLKNILKKELHELTPHDIGFMKARISYIGRRSREKFEEVLGKETPQEEPKEIGKVEIHPSEKKVDDDGEVEEL